MTTPTLKLMTAAGYSASRGPDGILTVHAVPIFVACERGDMVFDAEWIDAAVLKAKAAEADGYLPPLHVRHHDKKGDSPDVRAAGFFRILGTQTISFKGERRLAVMADLVITDPLVQAEVLGKRLPYRSVEIFNVEKPALDSLALLDHEAPFLELPMLMVRSLTDQAGRTEVTPGSLVASATFRHDWALQGSSGDGSLAASFKRGNHAHLLFREAPMDDEDKKPKPDAAERPADTDAVKGESEQNANADPFGKKPGEEGEEGEDGEAELETTGSVPGVETIIAAIQSGSISVADLAAVMAAIQKIQTGGAGAGESPEDLSNPASAPTPGSPHEAMQNDHGEPMTKPATTTTMKSEPSQMTEAMAALKGENAVLAGRLAALEADKARTAAVAVAMQKLEGRPLGADLEGQLVAFHAEHGEKAFLSYVAAMEKAVGVLPTKSSLNESQVGKVSAVAMKYQAEGVEAIDRAAKFSAEWKLLHSTGHTRISEEGYVATNMAKLAMAAAGKA